MAAPSHPARRRRSANNPQVISAYLGSDNNDDADGDSTTKAEPEPSIAKTLTEGAR